MAINFDIKLTKESQRLVDGLVKAGKIDLRPSLNVIGIGYRKEVNAIFEKQQPRQQDLRWAPLSEKYAQWKELHYPGMPILVRTGVLKKSMTQLGSPGNISLISKASAVFGTSIFYGIFHDSDAPRTKLPRRNFSIPSDRRLNIWREQIERDIIQNFKANNIDVSGDALK